MFFKTIKVLVLLSMGIMLVACSGLGITVKFDTEGPKLLSAGQQATLLPGVAAYALSFDEPIKLSKSANVEPIKITFNGVSGFENIPCEGVVDDSDPYQLIIMIPFPDGVPSEVPVSDDGSTTAISSVTFTVPAEYLTDEADNLNIKEPLTVTVGNSSSPYSDFVAMVKPGKEIPDSTTLALKTYSEFTRSVLNVYAGDTVADVVYVTASGSGDKSGKSWTNAANGTGVDASTSVSNLQKNLNDLADPGENKVSFLLMGVGTYKAGSSLSMKKGVAIVGGWATDGSWNRPVPDSSDPNSVTETIFDGQGSHRVFDNTGTGDSSPETDKALLHSVTVRKGKAENNESGGGMRNHSFSPTLIDVIFLENEATKNGGGMHNKQSSSPDLTNVVFFNNTAAKNGGGMSNDASSPYLDNVTFSRNTAEAGGGSGRGGGGMFNTNSSSPILFNVTFSDNAAQGTGDDHGGGGMYNKASSSPTLTNVTFSGNTTGQNGGGMYNNASSPTLINATFYGNVATGNGGGMYNDNNGGDGPTVINSLFWANTGDLGGKQIFMNNDSTNDAENMALYYCIVQNGVQTDGNGGIGRTDDPNNGGATITITEAGTVDTSTVSNSNTDLLLALDYNDGYVQTHALSTLTPPTTNPAIDKGLYVMSTTNTTTWYYSANGSVWYSDLGLSNEASPPTVGPDVIDHTATDARGVGRNKPDIGAFELEEQYGILGN